MHVLLYYIPVVGSSTNAFSALGIEERPHQSPTNQMLNEMKITEVMVWDLIQRHLHAWNTSVLLWYQLLRMPKWQPHCNTGTARLASWREWPCACHDWNALNTDETQTLCVVWFQSGRVNYPYLLCSQCFQIGGVLAERAIPWQNLHFLY